MKMDESKCGSCGELLPPVADAFCSYCQQPIERPTSQSVSTFDRSKILAIALLIISCLIGLATLLTAVDSGYRILTEEGVGSSSAGRAGWKMGQSFGALMRTVVGATLAACIYRGYLVLSNPNRYSSTRKLNEIVQSTTAISTSGVGHPNFYSNASDYELLNFFHRLQKEPNDERLKQLVFESRHRLDQAQQN